MKKFFRAIRELQLLPTTTKSHTSKLKLSLTEKYKGRHIIRIITTESEYYYYYLSGSEGDDFLFRRVIKVSKIQFSQFLHTSASKFSHGRLPNHSLLPAEFEFLFYIVLLRSKILVLFSWDFQAGNSKILGLTLSARSDKTLNTAHILSYYLYALVWDLLPFYFFISIF